MFDYTIKIRDDLRYYYVFIILSKNLFRCIDKVAAWFNILLIYFLIILLIFIVLIKKVHSQNLL